VGNGDTGALVGSIRVANVGKGDGGSFTGLLIVSGNLTSIAVQDFAGGLLVGAVVQH
jgi:hypothetical protein